MRGGLVRLSAISWACCGGGIVRPATAFHPSLSSRQQRISARRRWLCATGASTNTLSGTDGSPPLTAEALCERARDFLRHKNAAGRGDATLDPVFDMCSPDVDMYGLRGDEEVRTGLAAFFDDHEGIQHDLIDDPTPVGPATVQYAFVKSWRAADGEMQSWSSIDPDKPRNKVERLDFDGGGMLARVSVVEATAPLAPLDPAPGSK